MSDSPNVFQKRLKQALAEKGMRPVELAAATGISKARISQYTNGVYVPKSKAACLIASALGVSEAWLLGMTDSRKRSERSNISEVISYALLRD